MRLLSFVLLIPIISGVLLDPATFRLNAAHAAPPAPPWQTLLALIDIALLAYLAAVVAERHYRRAILIVAFETTFHLALSIGYLLRDGLDRFSNNVGHVEYLIIYLVLLAFRAVLVGVWAVWDQQLTASNATD